MPDKTKVTKRNGEKVYTLRHKIQIYQEREYDEIVSEEGFVFLVDHEGTINIIPDTTQLLANFELEELNTVLLTDTIYEELTNADV